MSESVFLSPKSIAVVGASDKQGSVGRAITSNIMNGYKGTVYPISPTRETVFDQKAYKSVLDVPEPIDLAVIITKNTIVPVVLEECGKKKIKGAIVITAGFKEVDEEGKKLEQKLKEDKSFLPSMMMFGIIDMMMFSMMFSMIGSSIGSFIPSEDMGGMDNDTNDMGESDVGDDGGFDIDIGF